MPVNNVSNPLNRRAQASKLPELAGFVRIAMYAFFALSMWVITSPQSFNSSNMAAFNDALVSSQQQQQQRLRTQPEEQQPPPLSSKFLLDKSSGFNRPPTDQIVDDLIAEAKAANPSKPLHFMEVGMHSAKQCIEGAKAGMIAHCIEPSPSSQKRIHAWFDKIDPTELQKVRYYQMAASNVSGMDLAFKSAGGTGDHVGGGAYDPWTMTKREDGNKETTQNNVIVTSVAIDDIIKNAIEPTVDYGEKVTRTKSTDAIDTLYMLKIDTQGHEPAVFSGVKESIQNHKIDIIVTEFWPKGMDFMNDVLGTDKECQLSVGILKLMHEAGYKLYATEVYHHPKAAADDAKQMTRDFNNGKNPRPLTSLEDYCHWFYELEQHKGTMADGTVYQMGYWGDILAVRPGFSFSQSPTTPSGKALMEDFL